MSVNTAQLAEGFVVLLLKNGKSASSFVRQRYRSLRPEKLIAI